MFPKPAPNALTSLRGHMCHFIKCVLSFIDIFAICVCLCHTEMSCFCILVFTCWERADQCDNFSFVLSCSHLLFWVMCGTWLYLFLIFAFHKEHDYILFMGGDLNSFWDIKHFMKWRGWAWPCLPSRTSWLVLVNASQL